MRKCIITVLAMLTFATAAGAQEQVGKLIITLDQQESKVIENVTDEQATEQLKLFLEGSQDGRLEGYGDDGSGAIFIKKGSKVTYQDLGKPEEMSLQKALGEFVSTALRECRSNLKNLGTASEMWSSDYDGDYTADVTKLSPDYLINLPTCPTTGTQYGYRLVTMDGVKVYEFRCTGDHSDAETENGFPRYNGFQGLVNAPEEDRLRDIP